MANTSPFVRKGNCSYRWSALVRSVPLPCLKGFTRRKSPGSPTEPNCCLADLKIDGFKRIVRRLIEQFHPCGLSRFWAATHRKYWSTQAMHLSRQTDRSSPLIVSTLSGKPSKSGWQAPTERDRTGFALLPSPARRTGARSGHRMGNAFSTSGFSILPIRSKAVTWPGRRSLPSFPFPRHSAFPAFAGLQMEDSFSPWLKRGLVMWKSSIFGKSRSMRQPADP